MADLTSRAFAALQACSSSSSDEEDAHMPVANPRMLNSHGEGGLHHGDIDLKPISDHAAWIKTPINSGCNMMPGPNTNDKPQHESERHEVNSVNNIQFSNHSGGPNLIFDSSMNNEQNKSVERHTPQFVRGSQNQNSKKMLTNKRRRKDAQPSASISVPSPETTRRTSASTKTSIIDKRKREYTAKYMQSIIYPTDKAINFQKSISILSLSKRLNDYREEEQSIIPHQLNSEYHNVSSFVASIPFDSRTMNSLHQAKEFSRPLLMQYEDSVKIMSQKEALRERNSRVDMMEEELLKKVECYIHTGQTAVNQKDG